MMPEEKQKIVDAFFNIERVLNDLKAGRHNGPTHVFLGADVEVALEVVYGRHCSNDEYNRIKTAFGIPVRRGPMGCIAIGWSAEPDF